MAGGNGRDPADAAPMIAAERDPLNPNEAHAYPPINNEHHEIGSPEADAEADELGTWKDPAIYAAIASAALFIAVVILQIYGLYQAVVASRRDDSMTVSWCSPLFEPFGISMADGDCHVYNIDQSISRGIGCIRMPGVWQRQWLTGTIVGTAMSLLFEFADLVILSLVGSTTRLGQVKMKRPWTTMISGLVVLCITLFYGLQYSTMLPPDITQRVTVVVDVNGTKAFYGNVTSAGLRGTIIGWNDGLFESWKGTYLGSPNQ